MFSPSALLTRALQLFLGFHGLNDPAVSLGDVTATGFASGDLTQSFLGIPFALAPRFAPPIPISRYSKDIVAKEYGPACIQQNILATATEAALRNMNAFNFSIPIPENQSEDCLSINVIRPSTADTNSQLPVVVFIYGGGFLFGDSITWDDMGLSLVKASIATQEPVIYVSFNYRLSAYGFLAGSEVKDARAGNVGLRDQREALRWVQRYIESFGGNPSKVTLWGQSAGGQSATLQMLAHDGDTEGLFRGVFSQSGAPLPVGSIENGQVHFDELAERVGCGAEANKLLCIRRADLEDIRAAVDASDSFFSTKTLVLTWPPRADGEFLTKLPYQLIAERKIAQVPLVTGNVDDEGTLFSLAPIDDVTNPEEFLEWFEAYWAPNATDEEKALLVDLYPNNLVDGSPFGTGSANRLAPQYKRVAAFQGDLVFQAPRRFFTTQLSEDGRSNVWVYLSKRGKLTPFLGAFHGIDVNVKDKNYLLNDYVYKFANHLNPNLGGNATVWPTYNYEDPELYLFPAGLGTPPPPRVQPDNHRVLGLEFLTELAKRHPL